MSLSMNNLQSMHHPRVIYNNVDNVEDHLIKSLIRNTQRSAKKFLLIKEKNLTLKIRESLLQNKNHKLSR